MRIEKPECENAYKYNYQQLSKLKIDAINDKSASTITYVDGFVQVWRNSIFNEVELLHYCPKPSLYQFKLGLQNMLSFQFIQKSNVHVYIWLFFCP